MIDSKNFELFRQKALLQITDVVDEPPICLSIISGEKKSILGTLGNFSVISGKAKSRKTFFVSAIVGAMLLNEKPYLNIVGSFPKEKTKVLYFDTEQGKFHARKVLERIFKISNIPTIAQPDNFQFYTLQSFAPKDKLAFIDYMINKEKNLGLVIIDGIRDVVHSINDEREATEVATYLLKWASEKNIHIVTVLHQNKADNNTRGHLGSELENKAESVITIRKDEVEDFSSIESKSMRDINFESFSFGIGEDNVPYLSDNDSKNTSKIPKANEFKEDNYVEFANRIFAKKQNLAYGKAIESFGVLYPTIGENKRKSIFKILTEKGLVKKNEQDNTYYSIDKIPF